MYQIKNGKVIRQTRHSTGREFLLMAALGETTLSGRFCGPALPGGLREGSRALLPHRGCSKRPRKPGQR